MTARRIAAANADYTRVCRPLLGRLPDGSLCCVLTAGGCETALVAAVRSEDGGQTWSDPEALARGEQGCAHAQSLCVHAGTGYLFWCAGEGDERVNHLLTTGVDGRTFSHNRTLTGPWLPELGAGIGHGVTLRDGRVMFGCHWREVVPGAAPDEARPDGLPQTPLCCAGVLEPDVDFLTFARHGRLCQPASAAGSSLGLSAPAVAEQADGTVSLLMRAEQTHRLWQADSRDGGRSWSAPYPTTLPNPGARPRVLNLPDGRILLIHTPRAGGPLEVWVSTGDLISWYRKHTIVPAQQTARNPDGFYDETTRVLYLAWEDGASIWCQRLAAGEI